MSTQANVSTSSGKIMKIHKIAIAVVCIIMGIINIVSSHVAAGAVVLAAGIILPAVVTVFKAMSYEAKSMLLSVSQTLVIIIISGAKGEIHAMFPLLAASVAISAVYYNLTILKVIAVITNVAVIGAAFMPDTFYVGAPISQIITGIVGVDIAIVLIFILTKWSIGFIAEAKEKAVEAESLIDVVNEKMKETETISREQNDAFISVAEIADRVNISSSRMLDFSSRLNDSASEQTGIIEELKSEVDVINGELNRTLNASVEAGKLADESCAALRESALDVNDMITAMNDISDESRKINDIIKTIDDIAFQTNILALNAAVEAARAGDAGKGFAVVADEVRNLATKSAEAAKNSAELIENTLNMIMTGSAKAGKAAKAMEGIIGISEKSAAGTKSITEYAQNQASSMVTISENVQQIFEVVQQNSFTAGEAANLADTVANEVREINAAVSK